MSNPTKQLLEIRPKRTFSETFKRQKVQQIVDKQISISELSTLYGMSKVTVYRWLYRYSVHHQKGTNLVVQMESEAHKTKVLQQKLAEAEQMIGRQAVQLDYLERLLAVASEALKVDLKKNFGTPPSNGYEPTNKKDTTP